MRPASLAVVCAIGIAAGAPGCATSGAAPPPELEVPVLVPPPAPPRIIATYVDPEPPPPLESPPTVEPATVARPQPRPAAPPPAPGPPQPAALPAPAPPALTLTPPPGTEAKTEASIRGLLVRASESISRVNASALSADGRAQLEAARRFVQQAEEALKVRNLLFAGKLADKAVAMSAVLVR
jgi:hypothetical protein